jgi:hypothetical protein
MLASAHVQAIRACCVTGCHGSGASCCMGGVNSLICGMALFYITQPYTLWPCLDWCGYRQVAG